MKINSQTRIKALLDKDQNRVIDRLVQLNANFSKLRNPILRSLLARRVTIAEACKIAKCDINDFLLSMEQIGFSTDDAPVKTMTGKRNTIDFNRETILLELDVRPYLEQDRDPLADILKMANGLKLGERMKIINSFEPIPLINLFRDKGFIHHTEEVGEALVITYFEKTADGKSPQDLQTIETPVNEQAVFDSVLQRFHPEKIKYIDVRSLAMPQPMLQIIAHVDALKDDELLYVYHKKVPVYLLPELNKKGLMFLLNHKSATELDMLIYKS